MSDIPILHWRRKLYALLHDSPDKASRIAGHEDRAAMLRALDQFGKDEEFVRQADWAAAAADRVPFPIPSALSEKLTGLPSFNHPLGIAKLPKGKDFASEDEALETSQKTRPFLLRGEDPRSAFICAWRFWRNWASDSDPRFTSLPADTRIPDHSIWHHLAVTSAFQGALPTVEQKAAHPGEDLRPRLLLFSVGPVQDFIAAARSTRDLWSGSYLLSYLVSTALGTIAKDVGPDQVMFPNLLDQPLLDHHLCDGIFDTVAFDETPISASLQSGTRDLQRLLTPSLPNRFLALLPALSPSNETPVEEYAASLVEDIKDHLSDIAGSVADFVEARPSPHLVFDRAAFDVQVGKLLEVHWQTLPIPESLGELIGAEDALETLLPPDESERGGYAPRRAIRAILEMAKKCPPQYAISATSGWGLLNALVAWLHDGSKSLRSFDGWREGRWVSGKAFNKDALNGKEEAVLRITGSKEEIQRFCSETLDMSKGTFKPGELLGASTLIKRLWHETWLIREGILNVKRRQIREAMPMPNTRSIAEGRPFANDEFDGSDATGQEKYFAILALDGDEMGKWISGSKSPPMRHSLSPKAIEYFEKNDPDFLKAPRAVTPSWHLQFSEALGNFSLHAAQRVVESFNGRLIYAGGDDVLAMLPATEALACARALRAAFRGEPALNDLAKGILTGAGKEQRSDRSTQLFQIQHEGYLQLHPDSGAKSGDQARLLSDPVKFPAIVPGPATDVSVGIAIAHFKSPLQDVVKAAQDAEKRAKRALDKRGLGRGAVAISLFKRSGEILEWGCKWAIRDNEGNPTSENSVGFRLLSVLISSLRTKGGLNARFPHKFEALLLPYLPASESIQSADGFEADFTGVLMLELDHCLSRNEGGRFAPENRTLFAEYWKELEGMDFGSRLRRCINLLRTAAWMSRSFEDQMPQESVATDPQLRTV